jgi:hypothetical protein
MIVVKYWTQYSGIRLKCCLPSYNLYEYFCDWPFYTMPLVFQETSLIPARWHVTTMYSGACQRWQLAMPPPDTPCCLDYPATRTNIRGQPCPGLAVGRPEAAAPCLHRCGSAIGIGIILHLVLALIQVLICVWWFCSPPCMNLFLISWCANSLGRVVVLCGCFCLADKQKYYALLLWNLQAVLRYIYLYVSNIPD